MKKKTHPDDLLPQRKLGEQNTALDTFLKAKASEIMALQDEGRMEHSWCPYPSLVGMGRFVKDTFIPPVLHGQRCWGGSSPQVNWSKALQRGHLGVWGTALALEDIPQLTGEVWKAGALPCQKLSSQSCSSCPGGMRQHCALKSIPTLSARDEIS